jgi:hypothetical protein
MHRMTTVSFVLFVVLSLALAILSGKQRTSVMDAVEAPAPAVEETTEAGGTLIDAPDEPVADEIPAAGDDASTDDATGADEPAADDGNPSNG